MLRPPAISPCAFTMSAGVFIPGATSVRTKCTVVPGV